MLSLSISVVLGLVAFFAAVSATATADFTNDIRAIPDDPVAPERYGDFLDHVKSARSYRGPARLDVDTMKRSPRRPRTVPRKVNQKKLMRRAPVVVESTNDPKKRQFLGKLVNLKMGGAAGGQKPLGGNVAPVVDFLTDVRHCGTMETVCSSSRDAIGTAACVQGRCTLTCPPGLTARGNGSGLLQCAY